MNSFCTLFDSFYLSRGLAMYESLKRNISDFHLYIFAFDNLALTILNTLKLENTTIISLKEFENKELLTIKPTRTKAEYCWTCTSSTIEYVLNNYSVNSCTYIDSDLFFYHSPYVLLEELTDEKTVLISEHRFSWFGKIHEERRAGRFCVQFITFNKSTESRAVLSKWKNQCIDWCYAKFEDGKFGDQKYLDEWPDLYKNVKISEIIGGGVAPWNIRQYKIKINGDSVTGVEVKTGSSFDLIYYHFHYVRFLDNGYIDLGWNVIPKDSINKLYIPYINTIIRIERELESSFIDYKTLYYSTMSSGWKDSLKILIKKITKLNMIKAETL
jgi:hypothetical protein